MAFEGNISRQLITQYDLTTLKDTPAVCPAGSLPNAQLAASVTPDDGEGSVRGGYDKSSQNVLRSAVLFHCRVGRVRIPVPDESTKLNRTFPV
jgi:hypothetical protein